MATGLVLLLTGIAPSIGAHLTGLLSPFPVYAGVLTVFAHRQSGDAANNVLKGLLLGLFSFAAFFTLLAVELSRLGIGLAFLLAIAAALTVQGASLTLQLLVSRANIPTIVFDDPSESFQIPNDPAGMRRSAIISSAYGNSGTRIARPARNSAVHASDAHAR